MDNPNLLNEKLLDGIQQYFIFNDHHLKLIEEFVEQTIDIANEGGFTEKSVDRTPLRNK